jgi:hypothetical protein
MRKPARSSGFRPVMPSCFTPKPFGLTPKTSAFGRKPKEFSRSPEGFAPELEEFRAENLWFVRGVEELAALPEGTSQLEPVSPDHPGDHSSEEIHCGP